MNFFPERPTLLKEPVIAIVNAIESPKLIRVEYGATYWFAKLYGSTHAINLSLGEEVTVVGIEGNTLLIIL